jgi:transposase
VRATRQASQRRCGRRGFSLQLLSCRDPRIRVTICADRGYDHDKYRRELSTRGITPEIARRQTVHRSGLGRARWVVECTFAWLHNFKRLLVRYDCRHEIHQAFLAIACCLVCFGRLEKAC